MNMLVICTYLITQHIFHNELTSMFCTRFGLLLLVCCDTFCLSSSWFLLPAPSCGITLSYGKVKGQNKKPHLALRCHLYEYAWSSRNSGTRAEMAPRYKGPLQITATADPWVTSWLKLLDSATARNWRWCLHPVGGGEWRAAWLTFKTSRTEHTEWQQRKHASFAFKFWKERKHGVES